MPLPPEHKALVFVGAVAVLGTAVRVIRASAAAPQPVSQPALERQARSADSAANAHAVLHGRGARHAQSRREGAVPDTGERHRAAQTGRDTVGTRERAPIERVGWINGRLDLDVATAAQIDSLPGVTPAMAKRIVADRMARGPFLTLDALRRVSGAGPTFLRRIASLVTFSGTVVQPTASDTIVPRKRRAKISRGGRTSSSSP